ADLWGRLEPVEQLAHAAAQQRLGIAELDVLRHGRLQIGQEAERARLDRVGGLAGAEPLERANDASATEPRQQVIGPTALGVAGSGKRGDQFGNYGGSGGARAADQARAVGPGRDDAVARLGERVEDLT